MGFWNGGVKLKNDATGFFLFLVLEHESRTESQDTFAVRNGRGGEKKANCIVFEVL